MLNVRVEERTPRRAGLTGQPLSQPLSNNLKLHKSEVQKFRVSVPSVFRDGHKIRSFVGPQHKAVPLQVLKKLRNTVGFASSATLGHQTYPGVMVGHDVHMRLYCWGNTSCGQTGQSTSQPASLTSDFIRLKFKPQSK
eukprot:3908887-Pyramimonas_sp.AAC.2